MDEQKIIILKYNDYSAQINLSRGANCISLRNKKHNAKILREPDYSQELDNPYLYGMPILFPPNRILGGEFEFEGRKYRFPVNETDTSCHLHGEVHRTPFKLLEISESRMVCAYMTNENKPYLYFPHAFEIKIVYELKEDGFYQSVKIINLSDENMPIFIGFHTTFNLLFTERSKAEHIKVLVEISEEYERNMENYLPTGIKPTFDTTSCLLEGGEFYPFFARISRHYKSGKSGKMVIYDEANDLSIVYENDEKYMFRVIYNGDADEYICLEPQSCMVNCPNAPFPREETGFDYIEPGKSKIYTAKISIRGGDMRRNHN